MSIHRVVFLGTPAFARYHLEQLLRDDHFDVVGVVTQPDRPSGRKLQLTPSPVKALAVEKNIPVFTPESMRDPEALKHVASMRAEAAVVVAYGQLLPQEFLDLFPQKVVNVHGSLLPRWRGAAPIQRAIMAGDQETGVCLQVMVRKLDAGPLIGSYSLRITDDMDAMGLHDALMPLGAKLLNIDFMDYLRGNLTPTLQDESRVTYAHKLTNEEAKIDWQKPAREIFNRVRGLQMGPGAFTRMSGAVLKVHKLKMAEGGGRPGTIIRVQKDSLVVACGEGAVELLVVQPESRPRMAVKDFLLGYPLKVGDELGI